MDEWVLLPEILMIGHNGAHAQALSRKIAGRDVHALRSGLGLFIILFLLIIEMASPMVVSAQPQIPFDGLQLTYFSETTQTLQERVGIQATSWARLLFHNVTASSSKMDINANATITQNNQKQTREFNTTTDFPTDRDTLIFLRNGGRDTLTILAGPSELIIPSFPGLTIDLNRSWNLYDEPSVRTPFGAFSAYRYHTTIKSISIPTGGTLDLDFYASYEMNTQVLIAGEVWATLNGSSALIEQTEIREANIFSTQKPSGCLIATATYGSDLAPQVQFLRDFRDQKLDNTYAGYNFMIAFNAFYYFWSPSAAGIIHSDMQLQSLMRILLYPLLLVLEASAWVFDIFSFQGELAAVMAGVVASALLGLVYLWIPSIVICKRYKNSVRRSLKPLAAILVGAAITLVISEIYSNSTLASASSAALVLANLLLFGALPAVFHDFRAKSFQPKRRQ
jgi:hypothetical protein